MQLKTLSVTNVSSLVDFHNDSDFQKNNLIFGTNGSGKSTLVELLHLLNQYHIHKGIDTETDLKIFFRERFSKGSGTDEIKVELLINSKRVLITYNKNSDIIKSSNTTWTPIKVFNEQYTNRTIGNKFVMELQNSGIIIGETNIELDKAYKLRDSLIKQRTDKISKAEEIVKFTIDKYKTATKSTANVTDKICMSTFLGKKCELLHDPSLLKNRSKLGFGSVDSSLTKLEEQQVKMGFNFESIEKICCEKISPPVISSEVATHLKKYTDFYNKGLEIYKNVNKEVCPFCQRDWSNAEERINEYASFIKSTYNTKRDGILSIKRQLESYKDQIEKQINIVAERRKLAEQEAVKHNVNMAKWLPLQYDKESHDELIELLKKKNEQMDLPVSVINHLIALQNHHIKIIKNNNEIIGEILREISAISSRRRELNKNLTEHFAKEMWLANSSLREDISQIEDLINKTGEKIERLEKESPPQDVIKTVFNNLLSFIGISEYFIDNNKRLNLRLDQEYDISKEGKRISSAQRKVLSLCYFFAEIISEVKNTTELQKYILVFDDPVDSADYIYFHSITSVIEKAEVILASILQVEKIKFGQFFVLTHNSLLHDRLRCGWQCKSKSIKKEDGISIMCAAEKTINNYNEYIAAICKYYKNPVSQKSQMIYIGNMIRRVLEILVSFDSLESNSFQDILDGMGKTKLAILANHLSHESFSKVLNPLSGPEELKTACLELFEVIKDRHPAQFDTIKARFEIELSR